MSANCFGEPKPWTQRGERRLAVSRDTEEYKLNDSFTIETVMRYARYLPRYITRRCGKKHLLSLGDMMLVMADLIDHMLTDGFHRKCSDPGNVEDILWKLENNLRHAVQVYDTEGIFYNIALTFDHVTVCQKNQACTCAANAYQHLLANLQFNEHIRNWLTLYGSPRENSTVASMWPRMAEMPHHNPLAFIPVKLIGGFMPQS